MVTMQAALANRWQRNPWVNRARFLRLVAGLLLLTGPCLAQATTASEQSPQLPIPTVKFSFDFPGSIPEHYVVTVASSGDAAYESGGKLSPDSDVEEPFHFEFTLSPSNRSRIFELVARARYLEAEVAYTKGHLANTGAKTLAYTDGRRNTRVSYNYSTNQAVQQLTQIFQSISSTMEFGRRLAFQHQYQKLALDAELKRIEEMARSNGLEELQALGPILEKIVADSSVINVVRARAQRLLDRAGAAPAS
jgi:multidrug efflux pump subunit AcrB